ncbi:hypothetical protein E5288_WYG013322 [Bos mutus]|uniref:non-specific serine/threonine protein kinase n=1 Tax=Bos mutus TaxID=72004 RepID=A0A6B0SA23_9CETA|nr:hypothetical protein [Bos mutus]
MVLRDLKLGNLLLNANNNVKISDFALNNQWHPGKKLDTFCGSPAFIAPELLLGMSYTGPVVDACSLGGVPYTQQETRSQGRRPGSLPGPDPARRRGPSPLAQPHPAATLRMPAVCEVPITLGNARTHVGPGSPLTPAAGISVATPVIAALPVTPETPVTPSAPATAAIPLVPASPVMPAAPVTPATPGIPASPMTP